MTDDPSVDRRWDLAVDILRKRDKAGALYLFKTLAREGERAAFREIGNILEFGGRGVNKDIDAAIAWYRKAVDEANDSHACIGLARIYYYGKTGQPDYDKALWYLRLVEDKDFPLVNLLLGKMHQLGRGVPESPDQAKPYFQRAAAKGNVHAQKELGKLEIRRGNFFSGMLLLVRSALNAVVIGSKDIFDPRLKNI